MNAAPLWAPRRLQRAASTLSSYANWLADTGVTAQEYDDYGALWRWSLAEPDAFWMSVWKFCDVRASREPTTAMGAGTDRWHPHWFDGAQLNFAENLLRFRDATPALIACDESGRREEVSYAELYRRVGRFAAALRRDGVQAGDRVAALLPNGVPAVIGMLAATSLGAVWSSCSPDFGLQGVIERFGQIAPTVLIACDGYSYGGKRFDTRERVAQIVASLPALRRLVLVSPAGEDHSLDGLPELTVRFDDYAADGALEFPQLPFSHPLYVLYSSGTTGKPKCVVHGAGGTLVQHLKELMLHVDLKTGDRMMFFTTGGWMMWNWMVSGLATGATLVLYDGSPFFPGPDALWRIAERERLTHFGTSPKYLSALQKSGWAPRAQLKLDELRTMLSTGSPLAAEQFDFVYRDIKPDVQLASISGGADIVSCFALGNPWSPVWRGEMQGPGLGMAVDVYDDDGQPLRGAPGELVCTQPFPSLPLGFWDDVDGARYHASYFERFADAWHHGDYAEITPHGGLIISGRSDATLNPGGVRIGTAEIYRVVDALPEVVESVVVSYPVNGEEQVLLFVHLQDGAVLSDGLDRRLRTALRRELSPRHVPAKILACPEVPRTISGKITEIAVRDLLQGRAIRNSEALANPQALDYFRQLRTQDLS